MLWFTWAHDTSFASVQQSLNEAHLAMMAGTEWHYAILEPDGRFCGRIGLSQIDQKRHRAEIGYWIDVTRKGRGLMTESVRLLTGLALAQPGEFTVEAYTDVENHASQRVLTKCGYLLVGSVVNAVNHPLRGWRDQFQFEISGGEPPETRVKRGS